MSHPHHEYPKMLYKKGQFPVTVYDAKSEAEHKGWSTTPPQDHKGEKGDEMKYATGEIAEAQIPAQDIHATEVTGADVKFGAEPVHGVTKK